MYIACKIIRPLFHLYSSPQLIVEQRNICKAEGFESGTFLFWGKGATENTFGNKTPNIMITNK